MKHEGFTPGPWQTKHMHVIGTPFVQPATCPACAQEQKTRQESLARILAQREAVRRESK